MISMLKSPLVPLLLAAVPAAGIGYQLTSSDATLAALRNVEATSLSTLRAGAPATHTLAQADRAELQRADRSSSDLAAMRAGVLTDHEMLIIGITVLAVILLIIIL
jgi:hypothetical protein